MGLVRVGYVGLCGLLLDGCWVYANPLTMIANGDVSGWQIDQPILAVWAWVIVDKPDSFKDSICAAVEIRPENATANNTRGSRANANSNTSWSGFNRVDGDFVGTTDQIIQWAACKWGIDEDIVRAQVIKESYWYQSANGDNGESWGLGQVRDTYHQSAFQCAVNARTSSAYNLDYTYASWRACYEGNYTWLNPVERNGTYAAGDVWGCVGLWFSGRWYVNNDAYLNQVGDSVRWHYNNKTWLTPTFVNG